MSLDTKKREVVQFILSIDNEETLDKISAKIIAMFPNLSEQLFLAKYVNVIEDKVDLSKIMKEQNFKGIDTEKMNELAKQADIQESIDDLLSLLD